MLQLKILEQQQRCLSRRVKAAQEARYRKGVTVVAGGRKEFRGHQPTRQLHQTPRVHPYFYVQIDLRVTCSISYTTIRKARIAKLYKFIFEVKS